MLLNHVLCGFLVFCDNKVVNFVCPVLYNCCQHVDLSESDFSLVSGVCCNYFVPNVSSVKYTTLHVLLYISTKLFSSSSLVFLNMYLCACFERSNICRIYVKSNVNVVFVSNALLHCVLLMCRIVECTH